MAYRQSNNPFAGIIGVFVMILVVYLLIKAVGAVVSLMYWIGPILLIIAMVLNYKVVLNYVKWLGQMIKEDTLRGLVYTGLSVIGFPFVSAWLFLKAFLHYRFKQKTNTAEKAKEKEFVEFEEVEDLDEGFLELPEIEKPKQGNDYDELFE